MIRVRAAGALAALVALLGAACGGGEPAKPAGATFGKEDAKRLVVTADELPPGNRIAESKEQSLEQVVKQVPGIAKADLLGAHQALIAIGQGPLMVSLAVVAKGDAEAARVYTGVRDVYKPDNSNPKVQASVAPAPGLGDESFAIAVDAEADGWIMGWRLDNAVLLLQAASPEGFPRDALLGFAYAINARAGAPEE